MSMAPVKEEGDPDQDWRTNRTVTPRSLESDTSRSMSASTSQGGAGPYDYGETATFTSRPAQPASTSTASQKPPKEAQDRLRRSDSGSSKHVPDEEDEENIDEDEEEWTSTETEETEEEEEGSTEETSEESEEDDEEEESESGSEEKDKKDGSEASESEESTEESSESEAQARPTAAARDAKDETDTTVDPRLAGRRSQLPSEPRERPSPAARKAWLKMLSHLKPPPLAFFKAFGVLPACFRLSILRRYKQLGRNSLSEHLHPTLDSSGATYAHLAMDPYTRTLQAIDAPSFKVSLLDARAVPSLNSGATLLSRRARLCLFDNAAFVGNQHVIPFKKDTALVPWVFDPKAASNIMYIRGSLQSPSLQLYIEVNLVYQAPGRTAPDPINRAPTFKGVTPEEPPAGEKTKLTKVNQFPRLRSSAIVELTVGWALIPFSELPAPQAVYTCPLRGGTPTHPVEYTESFLAEKADFVQNVKKLFGKAKSKDTPVLRIKLQKISRRGARESSLLPPLTVLPTQYAQLVALYREAAVDRLYKQTALFVRPMLCDPLLAAFPLVIQQPDLRSALVSLWKLRRKSWTKRQKHTRTFLLGQVQDAILELWPLLHIGNLPSVELGDNQAIWLQRQKTIQEYVDEDTLVNLGKGLRQWEHTPFNIRELAFAPYGAVPLPVP